MNAGAPLACPSCATRHPLDERFCPDCGMPLIYAGTAGVDQPVTATHERARKIKKQYLDGDLVKAAFAQNQAEAELIQGLLLEEGVPSMLRRTRGFDVPDMLAAGPRDIMVPAGGAAVAREILMQAEIAYAGSDSEAATDERKRLVAACLLVAIVLPLVIFLALVVAT